MFEGQASRTAERVAIARAAHQVLDSPIIFSDPFAVRVLDAGDAARLQQDPAWQNSAVARFTRAVVVVRSRVAEDEIARGVTAGITQYVLLGAGLDTFAYRNPYPVLRVFEIDHPATQKLKRDRLAAAAIGVDHRVTFVPCDFAREALPTALQAHGFDPTRPAVFAWLGVVMYLQSGDVMRTLGYLASLPHGTSVVFDYALPPDALAWMPRLYYRRLLDRMAAQGEPWMSFFEPGQLRIDLIGTGFTEVEDLGADEINARYLADRHDGLKAGSVGRIVVARR